MDSSDDEQIPNEVNDQDSDVPESVAESVHDACTQSDDRNERASPRNEKDYHDILMFALGMASGGMFGTILSAMALICGINMLVDRYMCSTDVANKMTWMVQVCYVIGMAYGLYDFRALPACELGYLANQCITNRDVTPERAAFLALGINMLFEQSFFGFFLLILRSTYRCMSENEYLQTSLERSSIRSMLAHTKSMAD